MNLLLPEGGFLLQFLLPLLGFLRQAAAALPFIAALTLIGGRRGNGAFCLSGAIWLLWLAVALAIAGPIWILLSYLLQVLPYHAGFTQMFAPFFQAPGLPWSTGLLAWLAGWLALILAIAARPETIPANDQYDMQFVRGIFGFSFLGTLLYFSTFLLAVWPFAGLPEGLDWERAGMAIWRHATATWFAGLCPAAAVALALWSVWQKRITAVQTAIATRWLSFWACAGLFPSLIADLGRSLGTFRAGQAAAAFAQGLRLQLFAQGLLLAALLCWAILLWKPRFLNFLAFAGLGLLLLKIWLPLIVLHL